MKDNEYNAAEVVEIGKPEKVILAEKSTIPDVDYLGEEPLDRRPKE